MSETFPAPERTALNEPYWAALEEGRLCFQRCARCGHAWLPARAECPECLHADWAWEPASGRARLVSWVVYHRAYHPAFAGRVPYAVALVELDEGPRLISSVVGGGELAIERALALQVEREGGLALPRFRLVPR